MSFRDTRQQARACRALLATVRLERLWTFEGPTLEAQELLHANGGHLSSGEAVMLRAAFDFWSGDGACALTSMLHTLDHGRLEAIGSLALALSDPKDAYGAVDRWLARNEQPTLHAVD
jgi:hypothetical protein